MFRKVFTALAFVLLGVATAWAGGLFDNAGWTIVENYPEPKVYQTNIKIGSDMSVEPAIYQGSIGETTIKDNYFVFTVLDVPKLKFIPICETLPPGSGTIECISERQVNAQATMVAWRAASLKLNSACTKVIIDKTKPMSDPTNIGFRCNGILTGAGLIPDTE
jgi:hypothetical protein